MSKSAKVNDTKILTIANQSVDAVIGHVKVVHSAVNTAITRANIDLSAVQIKAVITRNGRKIILFQESLDVLAKESSLMNKNFDFHKPITPNMVEYVKQTASENHVVLVPFLIDLGGVVNIKRGDRLEITCVVRAALLASTYSSSLSYVKYDVRQAVGKEEETPIIKVISIPADENNIKEDLGNDVTSVVFLNMDSIVIADSGRIIENIDLSSDKLNEQMTYEDLLVSRYEDFESGQNVDEQAQTFLLAAGDLNKVQIRGTLVGANVNSGQNYLVVRSTQSSPAQRKLAKLQTVRHNIMNARRKGYRVSAASTGALKTAENKLRKRI